MQTIGTVIIKTIIWFMSCVDSRMKELGFFSRLLTLTKSYSISNNLTIAEEFSLYYIKLHCDEDSFIIFKLIMSSVLDTSPAISSQSLLI